MVIHKINPADLAAANVDDIGPLSESFYARYPLCADIETLERFSKPLNPAIDSTQDLFINTVSFAVRGRGAEYALPVLHTLFERAQNPLDPCCNKELFAANQQVYLEVLLRLQASGVDLSVFPIEVAYKQGPELLFKYTRFRIEGAACVLEVDIPKPQLQSEKINLADARAGKDIADKIAKDPLSGMLVCAYLGISAAKLFGKLADRVDSDFIKSGSLQIVFGKLTTSKLSNLRSTYNQLVKQLSANNGFLPDAVRYTNALTLLTPLVTSDGKGRMVQVSTPDELMAMFPTIGTVPRLSNVKPVLVLKGASEDIKKNATDSHQYGARNSDHMIESLIGHLCTTDILGVSFEPAG